MIFAIDWVFKVNLSGFLLINRIPNRVPGFTAVSRLLPPLTNGFVRKIVKRKDMHDLSAFWPDRFGREIHDFFLRFVMTFEIKH